MRKLLFLTLQFIFMILIAAPLFSSTGDILWTFDTGGTISSGNIIGNVAIDDNGTIYITADNKTFAISETGVKLWEYEGGWVNSSPAIAKNGLILIGMGNELTALNPYTGSVVWKKGLSGEYGGVYNTSAIGSDGAIYVGADNGTFYSLNSENGDIIWTFNAGFMLSKVSPVIDNEGVIYFAQNSGKKIYALYDNGTLKWTYNMPDSVNTYSPLALGSDGTLYIGIDGELYSINRGDGTVKWHIQLGNGIISENAPAVGCDNVIYVGSSQGNVYAVTQNGTILWSFKTSTDNYGSYISTHITIGDDNTLYFGIYGGSEIHILYAIDLNGNEKWHKDFSESNDNLQTSVAIGKNGNLYIGIDKKLYAIESASTGIANCPWAAWRHDFKNTGNIGIDTVLPHEIYTILSDTGVNQCYNNSSQIECPNPGEPFYGQDGNFETVPFHFFVYEINGDKVVQDANNNLMWMQSTADTNNDGVVSENDRLSLTNAKSYCDNLSYAGYNDWKLPDMFELSLILNYGKSFPAVDNTTFQCVSSNYWTITESSMKNDYAWYIDFSSGTTYSLSKSANYYVRCVRNDSCDKTLDTCYDENQCTEANGYWYNHKCNDKPRFQDKDNATVTDWATGLMWQKRTNDIDNNKVINDDDAVSWEDALQFCEQLNFAGYTDWHLPNVRELQSIVDYKYSDASIEQSFFEAENLLYWTSTPRIHGTSYSYAWQIYFHNGATDYKNKTYHRFVRCVRYDNVAVFKCDATHLGFCTNETQCDNVGGYWYNNMCHSSDNQPEKDCDSENIDLCLTSDNCTGAGGYWYDNQCNKEQEPVQLSIKSGWSLNSIPFKTDTGVKIEKFSNDNILTIWKWTGSNWKIWSPDLAVNNLINSYGLESIAVVLQGEGFWVNSKNNTFLSLGAGEEYGMDSLNIINGWNLKGVGQDSKANKLSVLGTVKTVWKWTGNSWQIWSPDETIVNLISSYGIETIETISKGEGFWVNK
jgi:outer membrane protein assembly factor BamB